jgi:UDP-glucose 4-epimerase
MLRRCCLSVQLRRSSLFQRIGRRSRRPIRSEGQGLHPFDQGPVEAAVGKRDHVDVFGTDYPTPDGTCVRDYIHVADLANAHVLALERLIEQPDENLVMNCGYGKGLSVLEVLTALDHELNEPIRREMKPRRAGDPPILVASNSRLVETLDWTPRYDDIAIIARHALQWERNLPALPVD